MRKPLSYFLAILAWVLMVLPWECCVCDCSGEGAHTSLVVAGIVSCHEHEHEHGGDGDEHPGVPDGCHHEELEFQALRADLHQDGTDVVGLLPLLPQEP